MSGRWRLTPDAESALVDISLWTAEKFGRDQAIAYRDALLARCAAVAEGRAPHRDAGAFGPMGRGLRFARSGGHFLIFRSSDGETVFLDFLPARADLPARLARLTGEADDPEETLT
jgi:plasmid stabilization system protein ParE